MARKRNQGVLSSFPASQGWAPSRQGCWGQLGEGPEGGSAVPKGPWRSPGLPGRQEESHCLPPWAPIPALRPELLHVPINDPGRSGAHVPEPVLQGSTVQSVPVTHAGLYGVHRQSLLSLEPPCRLAVTTYPCRVNLASPPGPWTRSWGWDLVGQSSLVCLTTCSRNHPHRVGQPQGLTAVALRGGRTPDCGAVNGTLPFQSVKGKAGKTAIISSDSSLQAPCVFYSVTVGDRVIPFPVRFCCGCC